MIGFTARGLMKLEVEGLQRLPGPDLGDARRHSGSAHPLSFAREAIPGLPGLRRWAEQALTAVVQEAYVQGMSARSVDGLSRPWA